MKPYFTYIIVCADGTLYSGITTDIERRLKEHNESLRGAKYTRTRRPVQLGYCEEFTNRSEASKREAELKRLTREQKQALLRA